MVLFLNDILGTSPQTSEVFRFLRDINSIELGQKKSIVAKRYSHVSAIQRSSRTSALLYPPNWHL